MLTVAGTDRPGIVAALTDALFRGGANLGEAFLSGREVRRIQSTRDFVRIATLDPRYKDFRPRHPLTMEGRCLPRMGLSVAYAPYPPSDPLPAGCDPGSGHECCADRFHIQTDDCLHDARVWVARVRGGQESLSSAGRVSR
jgi:hypothetical protein